MKQYKVEIEIATKGEIIDVVEGINKFCEGLDNIIRSEPLKKDKSKYKIKIEAETPFDPNKIVEELGAYMRHLPGAQIRIRYEDGELPHMLREEYIRHSFLRRTKVTVEYPLEHRF